MGAVHKKTIQVLLTDLLISIVAQLYWNYVKVCCRSKMEAYCSTCELSFFDVVLR